MVQRGNYVAVCRRWKNIFSLVPKAKFNVVLTQRESDLHRVIELSPAAAVQHAGCPVAVIQVFTADRAPGWLLLRSYLFSLRADRHGPRRRLLVQGANAVLFHPQSDYIAIGVRHAAERVRHLCEAYCAPEGCQ